MFCLRRAFAAHRADLGVLALTIVILGIACGPTPNRKRRDASPLGDTGGFGGEDTGGSYGTGGGTGGLGTGGATGGNPGTGGKQDGSPDADVPDAAVDAAADAALEPDLAADLAVVVPPDAGVDAPVDVSVDAASTPDLAPDMAPLPPDLAPDATVWQLGLIGYWRFDESSGTSAFDSTLSENTGTLINGPMFSTSAHFPGGDFNNPGGITLDGVNDYVSFGATGIPGSAAPQTISLWVNYASLAGTHQFISLTNPTAQCGLSIGIRNGELRAWKWGGITLASRTSPPASGWHNIIYTFDGAIHTLIVDGVTAANTNTAQTACAVTEVQLGAVVTNTELFQGSIDDLRIYNRVITGTEIALIAAGADPTQGPKMDAGVDTTPPPPDGPNVDLTTNLVGYWKLDEGAGTTTADSSGNNNGGTIAGNPTWPAGSPAASANNPHSLALDGTDDQVQVGINGFPALDQARTVSLWFNYATAPTTGNKTYFAMSNRAVNLPSGSGFQMGTRGTNLTVWALGAFVYLSVPAPAVGWHHMVYTFDGTTHLLYLDGAQVATSTGVSPVPQNAATTEALIGNYLNGNERFTGRLDDVRVWKRVLTQAEVSALFSGQ